LYRRFYSRGRRWRTAFDDADEPIAATRQRLEQLDGVRLAEAAALAPSLVTVSGDGTFETRRAIDAGRAVAGEVAGARK